MFNLDQLNQLQSALALMHGNLNNAQGQQYTPPPPPPASGELHPAVKAIYSGSGQDQRPYRLVKSESPRGMAVPHQVFFDNPKPMDNWTANTVAATMLK